MRSEASFGNPGLGRLRRLVGQLEENGEADLVLGDRRPAGGATSLPLFQVTQELATDSDGPVYMSGCSRWLRNHQFVPPKPLSTDNGSRAGRISAAAEGR